MLAVSDNEVASEETSLGHGVATAALLDALSQWHPTLAWGEVYAEVFAAVKSKHPNQTPMLIGDPGLFVFQGGDCGPWIPGLAVIEAKNREVVLYTSSILGIEPKTKLTLDLLDGSAATPITAAVMAAEGWRVRVKLDKRASLKLGQRVRVSAPDVAPLRVYADGFQPDIPRGTGIVLTRKDGVTDVVVHRDQEAYTVALPDGSPLLAVPIGQVEGFVESMAQGSNPPPEQMVAIAQVGGSIDETTDLVQALVHLAKFRRTCTLQNPVRAQGSEASIRLDVTTGQATGEPWVVTGQPVTLTITSNDERVLYVSLWLLSASGAVQKLYPARSDRDTLYPAASLSVSVVLEPTQEAASEGALFKVFATEDPHDLTLLALDANRFTAGDLLALGRVTRGPHAVQRNGGRS